MRRRWSPDYLTPKTAELFRQARIEPDQDGCYDITGLRVEVHPDDLDGAYLVHGGNRLRVSRYDFAAHLDTKIPHYRSTQDSSSVAALLFADNGWTVVYWVKSGACAFTDVRPEHLEILRAIADGVSCASDRREAEVSYAETVLAISELYGCHGSHKRTCPRPGDRERSVIRTDGTIDHAKLECLRNLG
jgi:hypothetical protein